MVLGSYLSLCIVTDMTLLYLTLLIYLVQANTVQRARDVRTVFGPMLGQRSGRWASIGLVSRACWEGIHSVLVQCWSMSSALSRHCPNIRSILVFAGIYNIV